MCGIINQSLIEIGKVNSLIIILISCIGGTKSSGAKAHSYIVLLQWNNEIIGGVSSVKISCDTGLILHARFADLTINCHHGPQLSAIVSKRVSCNIVIGIVATFAWSANCSIVLIHKTSTRFFIIKYSCCISCSPSTHTCGICKTVLYTLI